MYFPDESILRKAIFLMWRHVLTLIRVATTVSVPIVAESIRTEELVFRDFSSSFLVKENCRQLETLRVAFLL